MAPLAPNNTARLFVDYTDGVNNHTISWRYGAPSSLAGAKEAVDLFLTALDAVLYVITVTGARHQLQGSLVSNPTTWTGAATYGATGMPVNLAPREMRFLGRGDDGRKVSVSVWGGKFTTPDDFRIHPADVAVVGDALDVLRAAGDGHSWVTIAGTVPIVYDYADVNFNSYWEEQARG